MTVILNKTGFFLNSSKKNKKTKEWESFSKKINTKSSIELLTYWKHEIKIGNGVLTGDFFHILEDMDSALLTTIEMLTDSNWKKNLVGWKDPVEVKDPLDFVEVYKYVDISNHHDLDNPDFEIYPSCHGIGKPWEGESMNGVSEEDRKRCNTYAIEFLQWKELRAIPLRIAPKMQFGEIVWKKGKKTKESDDGLGKLFKKWKMNIPPRDIDKRITREFNYTLSVGEFFEGIAGELCFFSTPENRKQQMDVLNERVESVEKDVKKGKYK